MENQDSVTPVGVSQGSKIVIAVADGLGGHPGGDIASSCAIEAIAEASDTAGGVALVQASHERIKAKIVQTMDTQRELIAMATTLTLAILNPDGVVEIAHVGDSRAYVFDGTSLAQITEDHTHGMDSVLAGELTIQEASQSDDWHILNNWLGFESYRVATHRVQVEVGDRLLLCTDGLTNMVPDKKIAELLGVAAPEAATPALIEAANVAGGLDNISVVSVEVLPDPPEPEPSPASPYRDS